jgi:hypothetical protein
MHSFNAENVSETAAPGLELAKKVVQASNEKIDDYYFRRKGLGVASLIITILAFALYRKIKTIEK